MVNRWLEIVVPRACALCGDRTGGAGLCRGCLADLPWITAGCSRCGRPLPAGAAPGRCAGCDVRLRGIESLAAALVYEYPVDRLLALAKYHGRIGHAAALGAALSRAVAVSPVAADVVVPVPLHPRRQVVRGYNQSVEIARPVAARLGVPLAPQLCRRLRDTASQAGLSGAARRANLRRAFVAAPAVRGRRVAVVDDVVTTGSTASAVACALRAAGAAAVVVLAAARVCRGPQAGAKV